MMWYWGGGVHWWGWLAGGLAMVLFWGLVIWAISYFVTNFSRHRLSRQSHVGRRGASQNRRRASCTW